VAQEADAIVLMTRWDAFEKLSIEKIGQMLNAKRMVDLHNIYVRQN